MSVNQSCGRIVAIFTAPAAGLPVLRRDRVVARPGLGLEGDRYALGKGHWSADRNVSRDLTLIEIEVIDSVADSLGTPVHPGAFRRNIVTRGVRLNELVGVRFRVGAAIAVGTKLCEPCNYLARLVQLDVVPRLAHRGGLRADLLHAGDIEEGAEICPL